MNEQTDRIANHEELLSVRVARILEASRERVFEAWTSTELIPLWWGPKDYRGISAMADPRPGGAFAIEVEGPDGEQHRMAGIYLEVEPPRLLCMEIRHRQLEGASERPEGYIPTLVRVELHEHAKGTELVLTHSGFLDAAIASRFDAGWNGSIDKLVTTLARQER